MEKVMMILFVLLLLISLFRLGSTYRGTRRSDRGGEIKRKLTELRKKRDEE
ncbi:MULTISPECIES: hypothetical protein [unclassified Paenibacillus]|uniref:hypothetical protein n=1 Tax=unclassified Paenibacillus TaxID=185978 RepID=UPI001AE31582|nr:MULTISPECIES: hypothetical protein [unclassified Paenibacillus]MBP1154339.1 hypothetical protein [Paenibacillus sp. PvP091]MBP1170277.1 hypothetical protein [Paenibacillus sp. PvR098]MBP2441305.1 hypothetical protein [Paenibacillus sp. PvP052]